MDMWMDVDTALSEVPVNLMPLIDDTDFKSRETAVPYNAAGMDLVWNFVTTAGAYTQTAVTPTTGGNYDWAHQGDAMYSIEIPASGGASINNDTEGFGWFSGIATGVLPWRGPVIGFRAAALNNSLINAGTTGLLAPTVAGRTLDVTATGEAGLDFSNVLLPTSGPVPALGWSESGTAQSATSTTLVGRAAATDNIVRPGNIVFAYGSTQGYWQSAFITSVSGDTFTIDAWPTATPSGTITYYVIGNPTLPAALAQPVSVVSGGITSASFAAGAINAAAIATDAIGANEIAADAVTKIQSGLSTLNAAGVRTAVGLASANLDTQIATLATASALATVAGYVDTEVPAILAIANKLDTALQLDGAVYQFTANALELAPSGGGGTSDWTADERTAIRAILGIPGSGTAPADPTSGILDTIRDAVAGVQSDTNDIQTRLPAALVSGRIDASVGAMATDVVSAAAVSAAAVTKIQNGLATAAVLATVAGYVDTEVPAILAIANKLDTMLELDGAVYRFTVNALEQAPAGGGGGSTDWTADQRTAIMAILGIPSSGTTPADPTAGILDTIRDLVVTVDTVVDRIEVDTQDLQAQVGTDGAGLTALPWNAAWDAEVQSEVTDALNAYDPPTNAEMTARTLAAANYATAAAVAAVAADVETVQSKTDQLNFTKAGEVDANALSNNSAEIIGDGTTGNKWRGA